MIADEPITGIFVSVIALYLGGLALLTWVSYRKTDSVKEFLAMGGTAGSFLTGFAYFATQFSMSSLVGVPGTLYFVGVAGLGIILPVAMLSMAFGTLVAGRRLNALSHSLELWTLPDYLASRFNSNTIRLLAALMIMVFLIPYIAAQLVGAGVIFNVFTGGSYSLGVLIMGTVVVAYCMLGGMRAAVLTDALQAVLMIAAAIMTFAATVARGGGIEQVTGRLAAVNPGAMSFPGAPHALLDWRGYASQILMWTLFSLGQPQLVNKFFVARSYNALVGASLLSGVAMTLTCVTIWSAGAMAAVVVPGISEPDWVVPTLLRATTGPVVASTVQAGILAAGMSTIDSILLMIGAAFSRDLYGKVLRPGADDRTVLRVSRNATLVAGLVALALAFGRPATIFQMVLFGWSGTGLLAVAVLAGLYWRRATAAGASAGTVAGVAALLAATFAFPGLALGFHPIVVAAATGCLVLGGVSLLTRPAPESVLQLHFAPGDPGASRRDRRYAPVFAACFFVPWLPIPFVFPWKRYVAGWFGVPVFVWVWLGLQVVAGTSLALYRRKA